MEVSWNGGTPKSSMFIGFSIIYKRIKIDDLGVPQFRKPSNDEPKQIYRFGIPDFRTHPYIPQKISRILDPNKHDNPAAEISTKNP